MLSNVFKVFKRSCSQSALRSGTRLSTLFQESEKEENAAIKIEASLFNNSAVNHEPTKKDYILKKEMQKLQGNPNTNISHAKKHPSIKRQRLEKGNESKIIYDQVLGIEFLKLKLNDPVFTTLLISIRSKKRRDKNRQIIIEGRRLILEALESGLKLYSLIFSQKEALDEIKDHIAIAQKQFNTKIYKVPHHDLKTWSTLSTPPGLMTIFERPLLYNVTSGISAPLPVTVICDNIREPNNLGSIIRTCAALPCYQIIITRGCCDPWESKALRGGCGGHFRLNIHDDVNWQDVSLMIPGEMTEICVFLAENNLVKLENTTSSIVEYSEVERVGSHNVVVIGGESHGISEEAYRFMESVGSRGKCLNIPLAQGIDSLNVASALTLILYELRKNIRTL